MFKHVLFQATRTTINVFSLTGAPKPERCQELMAQYNRRAKPVWQRENQEFARKQRECEVIYKEVFPRSFKPPRSEDLEAIPRSIAANFDKIFRKFYDSPEKCLLFGRTDDDALETQDGYGIQVATLLGQYQSRYAARSHLFLRKIYGRGAPLPLLSVASAAAMWRTCNSPYYQQQIATVGLAVLSSFTNLADPSLSSTSGSNPSRGLHPSKVVASYTPSTGSYGQA